jgi:hypothetical protein
VIRYRTCRRFLEVVCVADGDDGRVDHYTALVAERAGV